MQLVQVCLLLSITPQIQAEKLTFSLSLSYWGCWNPWLLMTHKPLQGNTNWTLSVVGLCEHTMRRVFPLAPLKRATKRAANNPVPITNGPVLQRAIARTLGLQVLRECVREGNESIPPGYRMLFLGKTYVAPCDPPP